MRTDSQMDRHDEVKSRFLQILRTRLKSLGFVFVLLETLQFYETNKRCP
jgi:hypothetical protein